ncbi:extracellular solute-binding protein [Cohnella sp. GCM10027633]|uniref:extracellular solute-binding protein n=1 Tax=unclassified Cohnella TaxID=2636738 RepID=UPI00362DC95B
MRIAGLLGTTRIRKALRIASSMLVAMTLGSCASVAGTDSPNDSASLPVITIMMPLHFPREPDPALIERIGELTGTRLEIDWVRDEIYADKLNAALTMNAMKQATFVKYTDYMGMKSALRSGMFWEIGPYLKDYPNLSRLDEDILNQTSVDDKLYGLYTERLSSRQGIILREDWLDRLALEPPGTPEELYEVLRQFTYNDPDGNGLQDTFGLADRNDLIFGAFKTLSSYMGTPNNWEIQDHAFVPEFATPPYVDTMNYMKRLYDEKLVNPDFIVTSKEIQRDLFITGQAGVYIGSMTDVDRLADEAQQVDPDARLTVVNRIAGPKGFRIWSIPNYNGLFLFSKSAIKTEEDLRQALAYFDRSMEADVANLMKYGVEGRHYTLVGDEVHLPERSAQPYVSEIDPLYALMIADLGNPNVKKVVRGDQLLSLAEKLSKDNEGFIVRDPTVNLESDVFDEKSAELQQIITDATYNYILGKIDQAGFDKEVAKWRTSGGNEIIAQFGKSYLE